MLFNSIDIGHTITLIKNIKTIDFITETATPLRDKSTMNKLFKERSPLFSTSLL